MPARCWILVAMVALASKRAIDWYEYRYVLTAEERETMQRLSAKVGLGVCLVQVLLVGLEIATLTLGLASS